jgi:hypothetical protein
MGRGNPNWIRAAKERRALALRSEQSRTGLSLGGFILAALLGAAIAMVIIGVVRSRREGQ